MSVKQQSLKRHRPSKCADKLLPSRLIREFLGILKLKLYYRYNFQKATDTLTLQFKVSIHFKVYRKLYYLIK